MTTRKYPRHDFWGAGEPDCPKDLKAPNGELCDMRCKVCGDGWRESTDLCLAALWQAMVYAPLDGTEVELLLHHPNYRVTDPKRDMWEQVVRAKWIDHNGGGWTWEGMYGMPMGWRPTSGVPDAAKASDETSNNAVGNDRANPIGEAK